MAVRRAVRGMWRRLRQQPAPLIRVLVYADRLRENYRQLRAAHPDSWIVPVLKSNAYGHGLVLTAPALAPERPPFIIVDSFLEARQLHDEGIRTPVLVIGYTAEETIARNRYRDVAFTVTSLDQLEHLVTRGIAADVHIKFDTGMHRHGLMPEESEAALQLLAGWHRLRVRGLCSHLADADGDNPAPTRAQIAAWNTLHAQWYRVYGDALYYHLRATKGLQYSKEIAGNTLRGGMGVFGARAASADHYGLQPALRVETCVTTLRRIPPGASVGYNNTFTARRETTIATIPMGYHEGLDFRLSSAGTVLVNGYPAPIVGKVSMNITTIDVTDVPSVRRGDPVTVISADRTAPNSAEQLARDAAISPYQLLSRLPQHLRRESV